MTGNVVVTGNDELYVAYFNYSGAATTGGFYSGFATPPEIVYDVELEVLGSCIKQNGDSNIILTADNIENFDTIFSKNVRINYLDNKITGEYLDFSLERNSMLISRKVVYTNLENILKADVVEINIKTKDTKIFMLENNKKVNIKSKN